MSEAKDYPLVVIRWRDSSHHGRGGWIDLDDSTALVTMTCQSVGWVIYEDEDRIVMAPHLTDNEQGSGVQSVPAECVIERHVVEIAPKAKPGRRRGRRS